MAKPSSQRSPSSAGPGQGGFTLLEVLVAFAIAAPALILLFGQGAASLGAERTAARYQEAISRARSHLDLLASRPLQAGEQSGDDDDGFAWRTTVVPLGTILSRNAPRAKRFAAGTTLFAVTVDISWPGPAGRRTVSLDTRRLGPAAVSEP